MKTQEKLALAFNNVSVMPCEGFENGDLSNGRAGVFTSEGEVIGATLLKRQYAPAIFSLDGKLIQTSNKNSEIQFITTPAINRPCQKELEGTYVFGGYFFNHFGHFLLESLACAWYLRQYPDHPVVWIAESNKTEIRTWQREILDLLGLKGNIHLIKAPTSIETLLVTQPGYMIQTGFAAMQEQALAVYPAGETKAGKKVWLSRSHLDSATIINEGILEDMLSVSGWTIFHPQEHNLREQLAFLSDAERIAGVMGSAFHTLILMQSLNARLDIINRGPAISMNFHTIAEAKKFDQHLHVVPSRLWTEATDHWKMDYLWPSLSPVLSVLGVRRPTSKVDGTQCDAVRRINKLQSLCSGGSYLEIGLTNDNIFSKVKSQGKVAVGEKNTVSEESNVGKNIHVLDISSEQFFATCASGQTFSTIHIHGGRAFEDVFHDLNKALDVSSKKTIIIIGATLPPDLFLERGQQKKNNGVCMENETFKTLLAIYGMLPTMSYMTVTGSESQIFLWAQPRHVDGREFDTIEKIANLSFENIETYRTPFHLVEENELMKVLRNHLSSEN